MKSNPVSITTTITPVPSSATKRLPSTSPSPIPPSTFRYCARQLVETRREGKYIRYRLADENVLRLWLALRDLGEDRLAEIGRLVQTFLNDRGSMQPVTFTELQKRIRDGSAVALIAQFRLTHFALPSLMLCWSDIF